MNTLIDTSVWSLALRRKARGLSAVERAVVTELTEIIQEGRGRIIGPVRQELLSGIKNLAQREKLRLALRAFPDEPIRTSDYEAAAKAGNDCRSKRIVISAADVLICAVTLARRWSIFTLDPAFKKYARVLPIKLHPSRR